MKKHVFASAALGAALVLGTMLPVFAQGEEPSAGLNPVAGNNGLTCSQISSDNAVYTTFHSSDISASLASYGTSVDAVKGVMGVGADYTVAAVASFYVDGDPAAVKGATFTGVYGIGAGDKVAVLHINESAGTSELLKASAPAANTVQVLTAPSSLSPFVILKAVKKGAYSVPNTADRG